MPQINASTEPSLKYFHRKIVAKKYAHLYLEKIISSP